MVVIAYGINIYHCFFENGIFINRNNCSFVKIKFNIIYG